MYTLLITKNDKSKGEINMNAQKLENIIKNLGHKLIEIRNDYLNSTIIIKTKENVCSENKKEIKRRIEEYIRVRVIFYSEGDLI